MLIDLVASNYDAELAGADLTADVCIVGAGPAGISIALALAGSGLDVLIVESGGLDITPAPQLLSEGEVTGIPYGPLESTRVRAFGGTARAWGEGGGGMERMEEEGQANMRPLEEADFAERSWVDHSGWPIGASELSRYYQVASSVCGVGTSDYGTGHAANPDRRLPIDPERLPIAVFHYGLASQFVTEHRRTLEEAGNVRLYYHATVTELRTDDSGTAVSAIAAVLPVEPRDGFVRKRLCWPVEVSRTPVSF